MMNQFRLVEDVLQGIGIGQERVDDIRNGAPIYGKLGILNSLEIVQFLAAVCDRTGSSILDIMARMNLCADGEGFTASALLGMVNKEQPLAVG